MSFPSGRWLLSEAKRRGIFPKKSLGQHFLLEGGIARKIAERAVLDPDERVVEIGPGLGVLTFSLLRRAKRVIAIEVDERMVNFLRDLVEGDRLRLICADALKFDFLSLAEEEGGSLNLVSNLPFNISTPLFLRLLEQRRAFLSLTLMFQREVAERITSPRGKRSYGPLSVLAQLYTEPHLLFHVPPQAFYPPPQVRGSVIRFEVLERPRIDISHEGTFKEIVFASFHQRRKTILNSLRGSGLGNKGELEEVLRQCGIDPRRRAETLSLEEWGRLTEALLKGGLN